MESHVHPPEPASNKNMTQTISLMVGFALSILGLCGLQFPAFAGLHLSIFTSVVTFAAGALLFWNGFKNNHARGAFLTCLGFGVFFGFMALVGFILGEPGLPTVGFQQQDPMLLKIIPGFLELGRNDILLNAIISAVLFGGAIDWWRRHKQEGTRSLRGKHSETDVRTHAHTPLHNN